MINCTGYRNYRQGVSVVGARSSSIEGGSYYATAGSAPQDGIDVEPNVNIHGPNSPSIVTDFTIKGVDTRANAGSGIEINGEAGSGGVTKLEVVDTHSYSNSEQGIVCRGVTGGTINHNLISDNRRNGISIYHSIGVEAGNNTCRTNGQDGIIIQNPYGSPTQNIKVYGNATTGNADAGIAVIGFSGKTVERLIISSNTSSANATQGIVLSFAVNVTITDNRVSGNSQSEDNRDDNILISSSANCSVLGNTVRRGNAVRQPRYGIKLSASTDTVVRNNDLVTAGKVKAISDNATRSDIDQNKLND